MQPTQENKALERVYSIEELPAFVGLRTTAIYQLIKDGDFPKPLRLSKRSRGWLESDIIEWQKKRRAGSRTLTLDQVLSVAKGLKNFADLEKDLRALFGEPA